MVSLTALCGQRHLGNHLSQEQSADQGQAGVGELVRIHTPLLYVNSFAQKKGYKCQILTSVGVGRREL